MRTQSTNPTKIHKKVLLLTDDNVKKINTLMKQEHVSMAEICRRAIESYEPSHEGLADEGQLEQLADILIKANQEVTRKAKALKKLTKETIQLLQQG